LGECHDPETHLIPLVLDAAAGLRSDITVFGNDYETPDGTCIRDYIHVSDLADAHVRAMMGIDSVKLARAYNLGTGKGFSVKEVIDAARRVAGRDFAVLKGPRRPGDPASLVANAALANRDLDWLPAFTTIDKIIETAWAWSNHSRAATLESA